MPTVPYGYWLPFLGSGSCYIRGSPIPLEGTEGRPGSPLTYFHGVGCLGSPEVNHLCPECPLNRVTP